MLESEIYYMVMIKAGDIEHFTLGMRAFQAVAEGEPKYRLPVESYSPREQANEKAECVYRHKMLLLDSQTWNAGKIIAFGNSDNTYFAHIDDGRD